jgi:hypothetical protein
MFIEWIANDVKKDFIDFYMKGYNQGKRPAEKMKPIDVFNTAEFFEAQGFEEFLKELEYDNNYARFYSSLVFDGEKPRLVIECLMFCFGDAGCDVHKFAYTGEEFRHAPEKIYADILKTEVYKYRSDKLNTHYIKKFMFPNIMPQQKISYVRYVNNLHKTQREELTKRQDAEFRQIFGKGR